MSYRASIAARWKICMRQCGKQRINHAWEKVEAASLTNRMRLVFASPHDCNGSPAAVGLANLTGGLGPHLGHAVTLTA